MKSAFWEVYLTFLKFDIKIDGFMTVSRIELKSYDYFFSILVNKRVVKRSHAYEPNIFLTTSARTRTSRIYRVATALARVRTMNYPVCTRTSRVICEKQQLARVRAKDFWLHLTHARVRAQGFCLHFAHARVRARYF